MTQRELDRGLNHLGALGLLATCAVHLQSDVEENADELRDAIERCFEDAAALGMIRWRRILSRFEVEPAASAVLSEPPGARWEMAVAEAVDLAMQHYAVECEVFEQSRDYAADALEVAAVKVRLLREALAAIRAAR